MVQPSMIWAAAKRVPSIRFRCGANVSSGSAPASGAQPTSSAPKASARSGEAIEDYLLPARYHRKPIPQFEIDYINRGGPE